MRVVPLDDADGARIAGLAAGETLVELLEPAIDESPIGKFIAKRGPGIHHVCFVVDDLAAVLGRCRAAGIRLIDEQPRLGAEGKQIAFLHPSSTGGVLIELTEA
jgi:methylmalonyl-CoA/ethylmalonyl-CoA epimerase